jgi:hypothetical protein
MGFSAVFRLQSLLMAPLPLSEQAQKEGVRRW